MSLSETARYLDAKKFVTWLNGRYGEERVMETIIAKDDERSGKYARRWYAWRCEQDAICAYTADSWLVNVFHLNLQDVPEDCFIEKKRTWSKTTPEARLEAVMRVEAGEHMRDVARDYGVTFAAVQKWVRSHRLGRPLNRQAKVAA